jgi:hypothetical protein
VGSIIQLLRGSLAKLHAKGYRELLAVRLNLDGPDLTREGERERDHRQPSWCGGAMVERGKSSPEFTAMAILSTIRRTDNTGRTRWRWRAHLHAFRGRGRSGGDGQRVKAVARVHTSRWRCSRAPQRLREGEMEAAGHGT